MSRSRSSPTDAVRVAGAVEPLVVVRTSRARCREKPPSSCRSRTPASACSLDDRELVVRRAGRASCRISSGTAACRCRGGGRRARGSRSRGREPELVADLRPRGARRAACAPPCTRPSRPGTTSSARTCEPEERLLLGDEVGARRSPTQRSRRAAPRRGRRATGKPTSAMPTISKPWPSHQPRFVKSSSSAAASARSEPDDADGDEEVGRAVRQPVRAQRAPEEQPVEHEARAEQRSTPRRCAARGRTGRAPARPVQRHQGRRRERSPAPSSQSSGRTAAGRRAPGARPARGWRRRPAAWLHR